jgi:hypothetical protein
VAFAASWLAHCSCSKIAEAEDAVSAHCSCELLVIANAVASCYSTVNIYAAAVLLVYIVGHDHAGAPV